MFAMITLHVIAAAVLFNANDWSAEITRTGAACGAKNVWKRFETGLKKLANVVWHDGDILFLQFRIFARSGNSPSRNDAHLGLFELIVFREAGDVSFKQTVYKHHLVALIRFKNN